MLVLVLELDPLEGMNNNGACLVEIVLWLRGFRASDANGSDIGGHCGSRYNHKKKLSSNALPLAMYVHRTNIHVQAL